MQSIVPEAGLAGALARETQTAVILADAGGYIRFWNAGAEILFGHAEAETAGRRVDLVVPHDLRQMHWTGFNRTMGRPWRGHDGWGDIDALHRSGTLVPLQVLLTPVTDEQGRVSGIFAMFRRREPSDRSNVPAT